MDTIINNEIRVFLISIAIQFAALRTIDMGLVRQKRMWWLHLFMIVKTMSLVTSANILQLQGLDGTWWRLLYIVLDIAMGVTMNVLYIVLWEGDMLHILLVGAAGEIIACPTLAALLLINKLENRSSLSMVEGPFILPDLLIPVGIIAVYYLLRSQLKRVMQFLGNIHLPFRGLWWTLFITYFLYQHMSAFLYMNKLDNGADALIVGEVAAIIVLFFMLLVLFLWYNGAIQKQEEKMLSMQLRLIRQRAAIIRNGREGAVGLRNLIVSQMDCIQERIAAGKRPEAADIEEYLRQLEQARMLEYRGQYCRDVLVDEMLSLARKSMERNGRWIDIQVRQYERGTIEEEDLVRLLYCLLETAPKTGGGVELILNASAKQLFISLKSERFALSRGLFTSMQRILRKYKGTISLEKSRAQKEVLIILQKPDHPGQAENFGK